jgi:hypothetical protein
MCRSEGFEFLEEKRAQTYVRLRLRKPARVGGNPLTD